MTGKKTALITGATGGIGEELCREFARQGYDLVITARSGEKLAHQGIRLRRTYGVQVHIIAEDIADPDAPYRIYKWFENCGVVLDVLVNNAGFGAGGLFVRDDPALQQDMIRVNLMAPTQLCRLFLPQMRQRGRGHVVNVASTGGFVPGPNNAVYCATKAYVLSLSEALAREMKGTGVGVTAVCPGATRSGFAHRARMEGTILFQYGVLSPKQVAREAYRAMAMGKSVHVVGAANQVMMFATRFAPRNISTFLSGIIQQQR